jgi:hypothetical protein|tara:strand:+ start:1031 stop:1456 length:426 start_codon:yes stop_codon:yes gene_type:complete
VEVFIKFNITDENKMIAWSYINRKILNDPAYFFHNNDPDKEREATRLFRAIKIDDPIMTKNLEKWCQTFLLENQFTALRASLRKKESRLKQRYFTVELISDSYNELNDLAKNDGISIKEYLARLVKREYQIIKPPVAQRKL